jgi:hypothetical protein
MTRLILAIVLCFTVTAVSACGGGGGGNTPQSSGAPGY